MQIHGKFHKGLYVIFSWSDSILHVLKNHFSCSLSLYTYFFVDDSAVI